MEKKFRNWLLEEEAGQGMVEYALIIGFIAVLLVGALSGVRTALVDFFNKAGETIANA